MLKEVVQEELEQILVNVKKPIVVDFGASWCGPCKMLRPILNDVSEKTDLVEFYYVDIDKSPESAEKYGIQGVPTVIRFEKGKEAKRQIGFFPEEQVKRFALD